MNIDTVTCGNCAELMAGMDADSIDLTVTSPPYDNLRQYNGYVFDFEAIANQLYRVTKQGGVVVWVVNDSGNGGGETLESFRQALFFQSLGFNVETMIYEKNGPAYPSRGMYYQIFEYMFILFKSKDHTFNPIKDRLNKWFGQKWSKGRSRRNSDGTLTRQDEYVGSDEQYGVRFNIWKYNTGAGYTTKDEYAFEHPATFPEDLARDHILSWSNPGDIVLDPMCGSGTTLKMAKEHGRHYIGMDISAEYCKIAEKRVRGANVPLFVMEPRP